jgi:hypothetical protein
MPRNNKDFNEASSDTNKPIQFKNTGLFPFKDTMDEFDNIMALGDKIVANGKKLNEIRKKNA